MIEVTGGSEGHLQSTWVRLVVVVVVVMVVVLL